MKTAVQEYLEFVKTRPELDDLYDALAGLAESYGFQYLAYTMISAPKACDVTGFLVAYDDGATTRTNYTDEWIARYDNQDYLFVDPVLKAAPREQLPFRWSDIENSSGLTKRQRQLFDEARDAGMNNGMTISLHGPLGGLSVLNLCGDISDKEFDRRWPDFKTDFFTAASFTHELVLSKATTPNALARVHLGPRERECLLWTAQGKTAWEIAQILDIKEVTVRHYLRVASEKFGTNSKHHAVVMAVSAGLIEP